MFDLHRDAKDNFFQYTVQQSFSSSLEISVSFEDGHIADNQPLYITTNQKQTLKTDSQGMLFLENLEPNSKVSITDPNNPSNTHELILERGHNNCEFTINKIPPAPEQQVTIRLLNEKKEPIPYLEVKIKTLIRRVFMPNK